MAVSYFMFVSTTILLVPSKFCMYMCCRSEHVSSVWMSEHDSTISQKYSFYFKTHLFYIRAGLYQLSHKGNPIILEWAAYPFSRGSSQPRNQTGVSCIAGKFFFSWTIREALILMSLFDSWPLLACWLFLPCLATVHICPLELRKGLRGWILFPSKKKTGDRKARSTTGSWSFSVLINAV